MPATLADIQRKYGESVYPLYKDQMHEPYMENEDGVGYKGVVLYDGLEDKVQCGICGKWYDYLARHISSEHNIKVRKYKDLQGLYQNTPLCSKKVSEQRREVARKNNTAAKVKYNIQKKLQTGWKPGVANYVRGKQKDQFKNKVNLCDAQIVGRLIIVRDMTDKINLQDITNNDILKHDPKLHHVLRYRFSDSIEEASKHFDFKFIGNTRYEDSDLISVLRRYVVTNKKIPRAKDIKNPTFQPFIKVFGSWNRAKMMAGLDRLLEEVKSK